MANKDDDYSDFWVNLLSHGYQALSEELLTPDIAVILSPDGSKSVVIGDEASDPPNQYNEQEQTAVIHIRNWRLGTRFNCPACEQSYKIAPVDEQASDDIIPITKEIKLFHCACGVVIFTYDKYESISIPFDLIELEPLHHLGMSRTADVFVRYVLGEHGHTLLEEVGVVTQHTPQDISLTDIPGFRFSNWAGSDGAGPSFISGDGPFRAYEVQIFRTRTYQLKVDTFEERIWHPYQNGWETVIRKVRAVPDNYANQRLRETLLAANESRIAQQVETQMKKPRGGDKRKDETKQLWADPEVLKGYARKVEDLWPMWTMIKSLAHRCDSEESQREWVTLVMERPIIKEFAERFPKLTETVLRRAVDTSLNAADRQPHLLACHHAGLEFGVHVDGRRLSLIDAYLKHQGKKPAPSTLKTLYDKGKALLSM